MDKLEANEYAKLGMTDSFYLAYRDIPQLVNKSILGNKALDFGCGTGRSTRFLKNLKFDVVGVDIDSTMLAEAKKLDPTGEYHVMKRCLLPFEDSTFDLIFSSIVFMAMPTLQEMEQTLKGIKRVLKKDGKIIIVTSTPEAHKNNWSSFICDLPENKRLKSGDRAIALVRGTNIKFRDYIWFNRDYEQVFRKAKLELVSKHFPAITGKEPYKWYSEKELPLWVIYILKKAN
jgi:ubiquinone/menaquinone biosynthesis C-methylase UbiE